MQILNIAYYTALRNFKDKRMLAIILLFPIVLILILGTALESMFSPRMLAAAKVAYLNVDKGTLGRQLDVVLNDEEIQSYVTLLSVTDTAEGLAAVGSGSVEAFVYVPEDYSSKLLRGEQAEVYLHTPLQHPMIRGLLTNYTDSLNTQLVLADLGQTAAPIWNSYVTDSSISKQGKAPRAIDYYAVQTLLQVMLMGAWYGIGSIQDDRDKNTITRLRTAPISRWKELLGKTLANVLVLFVQAAVVVLFSLLVYKANWSGESIIIIATLMLFSVLTIAMGLLIGTLTSDSNKAFGLLWCVMLFFSISAGAFGTADLGIWARLSPNYYAKTALFTTIYGGSSAELQSSLLVLLAATGITFVTALISGRNKA